MLDWLGTCLAFRDAPRYACSCGGCCFEHVENALQKSPIFLSWALRTHAELTLLERTHRFAARAALCSIRLSSLDVTAASRGMIHASRSARWKPAEQLQHAFIMYFRVDVWVQFSPTGAWPHCDRLVALRQKAQMAVPGNGNSSDDETFNQIAARLSAMSQSILELFLDDNYIYRPKITLKWTATQTPKILTIML